MRPISFSPPDIQKEDIEEVVTVLKSGWITTGPKTKAFEKELAVYCGTHKAICLNSATAGMELILRALDIGPGDEVITSAYTYTASASVICHVGAKPVLVDVAPNSYHLDISKVEQAITSKTKAVIAVDIGGVMCDYDALFKVATNHQQKFVANSKLQQLIGRIAVIADAAHSLGADFNGKKSGAVADFSSFSFHAVKNLTTAEGGAVTWSSIKGIDDELIYKHFMELALHGQTKDALAKSKLGQWEYDIVTTGFKYNMPDILAALGLSQLRRYEAILQQREKLVSLYDQLLSDAHTSVLQHHQENKHSSYHLYLVNLIGRAEKERNRVIEQMAERGIATNVHYKPLPMLSAYNRMGFHIKDYPNAYEMYKAEITLPLHTRLKEEDIIYIAHTLKTLLKQ